MMPDAKRELPYDGAGEMLLADVEDRTLMRELLPKMYGEVQGKKR